LTILDEIIARKATEVAEAKARVAPEALADRLSAAEPRRGFRRALVDSPAPAVIAEIKKRSPSKGEIRKDFDPVACATAYLDGGAAALSVLTDEHYFGGHLDFLGLAREAVPLPILRKDFMIDPYQIDEAMVFGADAILLIVAALEAGRLRDLYAYAKELGLDVLVEVHDAAELDRARTLGADLIGVNNRDLKTFSTRLEVTEVLAPKVPEQALLVAESGIHHPEDIRRLQDVGARAFLVGESLMRQRDPGDALKTLRGL
jgi:indole-3-glycerol phosphate synthase